MKAHTKGCPCTRCRAREEIPARLADLKSALRALRLRAWQKAGFTSGEAEAIVTATDAGDDTLAEALIERRGRGKP